ncbi:MAG: baseplate J/gp47 family protein [Pseudomonadota bacterium]|nr:baseplate J/gp47 family protein [Pseudomonadota bacterium]
MALPTLQTQTFDQLVQTEAAAIQAGSGGALIDFSVGSILRAFAEAVAMVAMWLQGLILQLLTTTRAATASGTDLDSWMADYGVTRLPAAAAAGTVIFSRFTATQAASIPLGAKVQSADGTQQFFVVADGSQAAYNDGDEAYLIPAGVAAISATVQAMTPGLTANLAAGAISALGQSISGVDSVTNTVAFVSGAASETDAALRVRFVNYLASLAKATKSAVGNAIASLQEGLNYTLTEDFSYAGAYQPGYFYVVVDDGSGSPPAPLLALVSEGIDTVRGCGIQFGVFAPMPVTAALAVTITPANGYAWAAVAAAVKSAILTFIQALPVGASLSWSRLYQVIYAASPGVATVTGLTVNGGTSDLIVTPQQAVIPGLIVVS